MGDYFFKGALNYSLGDEDSVVEYKLAEPNMGHICTISGSGSRVIPLLAKQPKHMVCVDVCPAQLALTQMRIAAMQQFDYHHYLKLLGYIDATAKQREALLAKLDMPMQEKKWLQSLMNKNQWQAPIYYGKFERTLILFSKLIQTLLGKHARDFLACTTLTEQHDYLKHRFPYKRWYLLMRLLANATLLNTVLYKGDYPKKNIPGSYFDNYQTMFARLFEHVLARESFFLQLLFSGKLSYRDGFLLEADKSVFTKAKMALAHTQVTFFRGDILDALRQGHSKTDFISYSDVPTFFDSQREKGFLQEKHHFLNPGAKVVYREHMKRVAPITTGYYKYTTDLTEWIKHERTGLWNVEVQQKV